MRNVNEACVCVYSERARIVESSLKEARCKHVDERMKSGEKWEELDSEVHSTWQPRDLFGSCSFLVLFSY